MKTIPNKQSIKAAGLAMRISDKIDLKTKHAIRKKDTA